LVGCQGLAEFVLDGESVLTDVSFLILWIDAEVEEGYFASACSSEVTGIVVKSSRLKSVTNVSFSILIA
jgi:hypothetical protein